MNKEIIQRDGWAADSIIYSNYSHNEQALLITDSILSESLEKGKDGKNLMTKLELLENVLYDNIKRERKKNIVQIKLFVLIDVNNDS